MSFEIRGKPLGKFGNKKSDHFDNQCNQICNCGATGNQTYCFRLVSFGLISLLSA
jgi:hypothetical protein